MRRHRGFTLAELIVVLMLIGILAVVALPRLFDKSGFASRGAHDFVGSSLRYAQKSAVAMRRNVCVSIGTTSLDVTHALAAGSGQVCAGSVPNPATGQAFGSSTYEQGATVAAAALVIFDALGRPLSAPSVPLTTALTITVNGHATPITIEPETGYVH
ncbi:pilus assembly FimT family protein [Piscinibacter sp.]|uniref:pilus assembly FimT family protein n=1 Tax=Piscinibacter sp. TaxID=1903157 RepID=UPI002C3CB9A1|nr:type II secretion system protein [Albitalea sp.]HUG22111.1 type II secretion system protein [Albitalea sp.]